MAACVVSVFAIVTSSSLAALIFSGELSFLLPQGIQLALYTAMVVGAYVAITSSFQNVVAIPQDRIAPILAIMVSGIAVSMRGAPQASIGITVLASIPLVALVTGLFLFLLGRFQLGKLIRYIPYPVIGGFLAGSGWLLLGGAMRVTTGHAQAWGGWLFEAEVMMLWVPAILFGGIMFAALKCWKHYLVPPLMLAGSIMLFYCVLALYQIPLADVREMGWLRPVPEMARAGGLIMNFTDLLEVDWLALSRISGILATILATSVVSILLTASALELSSDEEIDLNRELRSAGIANLLSAAGGGMVGFHSLSLSQLVISLGGRGRYIGLISAGFCGLAFFAGAQVISYIPPFVCGGLLFFLGFNFLWDWLVDGWRRLSRLDYAVVILILAVIGTAGYPQGVLAGLLFATILFIHNYSRVDVVRHALTWGQVTSNVDRPLTHVRELRERAEQMQVLILRGYIFFGTASHILHDVRDRLDDARLPPLKFVLLNFHHVTGVDSSALLSLIKLRQLAERHDFELILTHLSGPLEKQLLRSQFLKISQETKVRVFPDLDHGMEYCEDSLLSGVPDSGMGTEDQLMSQLEAGGLSRRELEALLPYLERLEIPAGEKFIAQNDPADSLYFVESGRVTVGIRLESGGYMRLRVMGPGTVVGEVGLYLRTNRTADVVASEDCVLHRLSAEAMARMRQERPEIDAAFHYYMVCMMAERMGNTNRVLRVHLES